MKLLQNIIALILFVFTIQTNAQTFTDQLTDDVVGEAPTKWNLIEGTATIGTQDSEKVILLDNKTIIAPKIGYHNYLSNNFTLKFQAYFDDVEKSMSYQSYSIRFWNGKDNYNFNGNKVTPLKLYRYGMYMHVSYPTNTGNKNEQYKEGKLNLEGLSGEWRDIIINYNAGTLKVTIDRLEIIEIPNIRLTPSMISIQGEYVQASQDYIRAIKNITISGLNPSPTDDDDLLTDDTTSQTDSIAGTGLEAIDEGNGIGWRLIGKDPKNYGNIGKDAVDLSYSSFSGNGATGAYSTALGHTTKASSSISTAMGTRTTASGFASTAMGENTTASGSVALAMGTETIASGNYSTAIGYKTMASVDYSTAMGTETKASGEYSTSMGYLTTASGNMSTAIGTRTTASGFGSTAMGEKTTAAGTASVAMGWHTVASGDYSTALGNKTQAVKYATALGNETEATNYYATALGNLTKASGKNSTAMGFKTESSGEISTAMGYKTIASGINSTAFGLSTKASGVNSTAMGSNTKASGTASFAVGINSIASGAYSTSMGASTIASGSASTAMGFHTKADAFGSTAIGSYNKGGGDSKNNLLNNPVFEIGNGTSDENRSNAFTVFYNGNATLARTLTQNSDRRLKQDINNLNYGLQEILELRPVAYHWKTNPDAPLKSLGLIAQEVQPLINEIVRVGTDKDKTLSVSYTELIPVLIKAIQEQQHIINNQDKKIEDLSSSLTDKSTALIKLTARIKQIETILNTDKL